MTTTENPTLTPTGEKADLLGALAQHRFLFRHTVQGLTDEQAAATPTASELCLGGLVKHVARGERDWLRFVVEGTAAVAMTEDSYAEHAASFRMLPGETLAGVLAEYDAVAARTEEIVTGLPSLDVSHPLPEAPWFEPGAAWSARRVLAHVIAETAQHAGHADILRETIDGQKTMG
ncbi:DinB family protein [Pseudonocardia sp. RS010]|uniref:DinB family protein n=1 Tax=Pseudonocardia sp. RS010 TaxID=3385979 RepID=UPI0039A3EE77